MTFDFPVLSFSFIVTFVLCVLGVVSSFVFAIKLSREKNYRPLGIVCGALSVLVFLIAVSKVPAFDVALVAMFILLLAGGFFLILFANKRFDTPDKHGIRIGFIVLAVFVFLLAAVFGLLVDIAVFA